MAAIKLSPEALRAERRRRIEARRQATAATTPSRRVKASGAPLYDAERQKPTALGPNAGIGYHWYGRMPDDGSAYGCYRTTAGAGLLGRLGGKGVFDPKTGKPARLIGPAPADAVRAVRAAASKMRALPACAGCGVKNLVTSAADGDADDAAPAEEQKLFCPECGAEIPAAGAAPVLPAAPAAPAPMPEMPLATDAPKPEGEAEAVRYETLASIDTFANVPVVAQDVEMQLYDHETANPFWNVTIKGQPMARVYLQDQDRPAEIKATFCAPRYQAGVAQAIALGGLRDVAQKLRFRLWSNEVRRSNIAAQVEKEVSARLEQQYRRQVETFNERQQHCLAIANAALDKNIYPNRKHDLKAAIFAEFRQLGLSPTVITQKIEAAFRNGATAYNRTLFALADEYRALPKETLATLENLVGNVSVDPAQNLTDDQTIPSDAASASPATAATLQSRLAQASMPFSGTSDNFAASPGDLRSALKATLGLGGAGSR